jgi:hypothetical protein
MASSKMTTYDKYPSRYLTKEEIRHDYEVRETMLKILFSIRLALMKASSDEDIVNILHELNTLEDNSIKLLHDNFSIHYISSIYSELITAKNKGIVGTIELQNALDLCIYYSNELFDSLKKPPTRILECMEKERDMMRSPAGAVD